MTYPTFYGKSGEDAHNFLDELELMLLMSGQHQDEIKLRAFSLVLKEEARSWYRTLSMDVKSNWRALKEDFLKRFSPKDTPEEIWKKLEKLRQENLRGYDSYEMNFLALLTQLEEVSDGNEHVADFLVRTIFSNGLFEALRDRVEWEGPKTFHETIHVARRKYRKMMYKLHKVVVEIERLPPHRRYEKLGISFGPSPKGVTSQLKIGDPHPQIQFPAAKDPNKVLPHVEEAECTKEVIFEIVDVVVSKGSHKEEDSQNLKHEEELMIMGSAVDRSINQQVVFAQKEEEEERSRIEMAKKAQVVPNTEGKLQLEFEVNSFPTYSLEDAPSFESKGEGFLPQEYLALSDLAYESEATCFVKELLCNNMVVLWTRS